MKKKDSLITLNHIEVRIDYTSNISKLNSALYTIEINNNLAKNLEVLENELVLLIYNNSLHQPETKIVHVVINNNTSNSVSNDIKVSAELKKIIVKGSTVKLTKIKNFKFNTYLLQHKDKVYKNIMTLSPETKFFFNEYPNTNTFQFINTLNGNSINIKKDKIEFDDALKPNQIRLNTFYRQLLETAYPKQLSNYYYSKLDDNLILLKDLYKSQKSITDQKDTIKTYNDKLELQKKFKESGLNNLVIYPIITEHKFNIIDIIKEYILKIFISDSSLILKVIRPYETDEFNNVVRLTKSSLELLGMEETDVLEINYKNSKITARALLIDEFDSINETNMILSNSELNMSVGIPLELRSKLNIDNIGSTCEVKRDKLYLLRKNISLQFLSIMGSFITINQLDLDIDIKIKFLITLISFPIISYFLLSSVRNKVTYK